MTSTVELLRSCRLNHLKLSVDGEDRLALKGDKSNLTPALVKQIKANKSALVELLKSAQAGGYEIIPHYPLSFAQQRLWFINELSGSSAEYNMPGGFMLRGQLNKPTLLEAIRVIVSRHEVLRTNFIQIDGEPVQILRDETIFQLDQLDLRSSADSLQELDKLCYKQAIKPFDLSQDCLLRVMLIQLKDDEHVLLFNIHHIASDGWSMGLLINEFISLYSAFAASKPSPLAPLAVQYRDFARWQRDWLQGETLDTQLNYWRNQLSDIAPVHNLPLDKERPAEQTFNGASYNLKVDAHIAKELQQICHRQGVTLFMLMHTAFAILLSRYSGETNIVVGSPIAGRSSNDVEPLIGFFVNTLVIRSDINGQLSFNEQLEKIKQTVLAAYQHQHVPFEMIIEQLNPQRSLAYSPLVQILLTVNNNEVNSLSLPQLELEAIPAAISQVKCDLELSVIDVNDGLQLHWSYNQDLFVVDTIAKFAQHLVKLLEAIVTDPSLPLYSLNMLTNNEQQQLLNDYNQTQVDYPKDQTVNGLFEAQQAKSPEAVAVEFEGQQLSYKALNDRANQLAALLVKRGVTKDNLVGICLERSIEMVVSILAILKAGGAYVPMDPDYPTSRLAYMLEDGNITTVLTISTLQSHLPNQTVTVCLDNLQVIEQLNHPQETAPLPQVSATDLAYVIYTSGSTGKPKGVMVEHRALINRIDWMHRQYGCDSSDRILQKTPYSFDVSVWEFIWPLHVGAAMVLAKANGHKDPQYLVNLIRQSNISKLHFVPSMLSGLLALQDLSNCPSLKQVFCSGEALPLNLANEFVNRYPNIELHNLYGPTEAAIDVSYFECSRGGVKRSEIPIGRPIQNIQLYVMDDNAQLLPYGALGQLHIAGDGLARGYLNQPELTAQRFIDNPYQTNSRLYKTGDIVRWLPDGQIAYMGRTDHQVKIRGFRIETGEIEHVISTHQHIHECVVMAMTMPSGDLDLVAYVVVKQQSEQQSEFIEQLKQFSAQQLPEHMQPKAWVILEQLPLTGNGKLDRKALPTPRAHDLSRVEYQAPRNPQEQQIAAIWAELLGVERVGINDSFFALGGHSILLIKLVSLMNQQGLEVLAMDVMRNPSISQLLAALQDNTISKSKFIEDGQDIIHALPNKQLLFKGPWGNRFNVTSIYNVIDAQPDKFEQALRTTITIHEGLTHYFYLDDDNKVCQSRFNLADLTLLETVDLSHIEDEQQLKTEIEALSDQYQGSIDLTNRLFRFVLFQTGQYRPSRFLIIIHHALIDGFSDNVFFEQLSTQYLSLVSGVAAPKSEQTSSMQQWGAHVYQFANQQHNQQTQLDFWRAQPWHQLVNLIDYPDGIAKNTSGQPSLYGEDKSVKKIVSKQLSQQLIEGQLNQAGVNEKDIFFVAFAQAVASITQAKAVFFEMFINARGNLLHGVDASKTVGFLSEYVPVLIEINDSDDLLTQFKSHKQQLDHILSHGIAFNAIKTMSEDKQVTQAFAQFPAPEFNINFMPRTLYQTESNTATTQVADALPWHLLSQSEEYPGHNMAKELTDIIHPSYITIQEVDGCYELEFTFRDNVFKLQTVEGLMQAWLTNVEYIIADSRIMG